MLKNTLVRTFNIISSLPVLHYFQLVLFIKKKKNLKYFHEYLIQHSLKSGGTKDHFRWVKVSGTALTERPEDGLSDKLVVSGFVI